MADGISFVDKSSAQDYRKQLIQTEGQDSTLKLEPNTGMWIVKKHGPKRTNLVKGISFTENQPIMSEIVDEDIPLRELHPNEYKLWEDLYRRRLTRKKFENWLEQDSVEKEVEYEEAEEELEEERTKAKERTSKEIEKREKELSKMLGQNIIETAGEGKSPGKGLIKQAKTHQGARIRLGAENGGPRIGVEGAIGTTKPAIGDIKASTSDVPIAMPMPDDTPLKDSPNPKKLGFSRLGRGFADIPRLKKDEQK